MRLKQAFLKLPKRFCAETLAAEVRALPGSAWLPHPGNYPGNDAALLVTPEGRMTNGFTGQMAATENLLASPYIQEVMADIGAVWGRSRLMGLAPGAWVPPHVDVNYHWRTHMRIHIPVITNPAVKFTCDDEAVHMAAGECWVFDSFRMHNVHNGGVEKRVHLVLDTVGGEELWELVEAAQDPKRDDGAALPSLQPGERRGETLSFERVDMARLMSPWEIRCHVLYLAEHVQDDPRAGGVFKRLEKFIAGWAAAWGRYGDADDGIAAFQQLIAVLRKDLLTGGGDVLMRNQVPIARALDELVFQVAIPARPVAVASQRLAS